MFHKKSEKGQALIIIVISIIGLIGMTGLAVDGGRTFVDRQGAQNSADSAALAGALANSRGQDITKAAIAIAATTGYPISINDVTIDTLVVCPHIGYSSSTCPCPDNSIGYDISVQITSHVKTSFAPLVGITEMTNNVFATSRSCGTYVAPIFNGNALVSLGTSGVDFSTGGSAGVTITGSGVFSNSATCASIVKNGNGLFSAPYLTTIKSAACGVDIDFGTTPVAPNATPYSWLAYKETLPPSPACADGAATITGSNPKNFSPKAGTTGSTIDGDDMIGDMNFAAGLYCIINNNPKNPGQMAGTGVTFYSNLTDFSLNLSGSGAGFGTATTPITAPTSGNYKNVLIFLEPNVISGVLQHTQILNLRGNGNTGMSGSIIAPSADVNLTGNSSGTAEYQTQVVGYTITVGGSSNVKINYDTALNYTKPQPAFVQLLK